MRWLCVGLVVMLIAYFPLTYYLNSNVRASALAQASLAREKGDVDLALRHLDRYLVTHPDDVPTLEAKSKILGSVVLPFGKLLDAASTMDHLIRLDPDQTERQETRRKLAELYIRYSDDLKILAESEDDSDAERKNSRYAAAALIAGQLVDESNKRNDKDPVAHRLLARAGEGQISDLRGRAGQTGGKKSADRKGTEREEEDLRLRTIKNYKIAIEQDPNELESYARLANLYRTWLQDPGGSDSIFEAMVKANPQSVDARLLRYRVYTSSGREKDAKAELDAVLALDPKNVPVRIEAASVALNRRDAAEARQQLDAIPAANQEDLRVKVLRGYMEFAEQHPDDAIDQWRRGLLLVGGSNQELTWKLAFNLIQLGRYAEAEPLRVQYARLAKGDRTGMGKYLDALFDMGYGRLYDAREKLEKIKDVIMPQYRADVLLSLGRCCEMTGDQDAALLFFRSAASASPGSSGPRLLIARHLFRRHPDEAIQEVDRALTNSPKETNLILEAIRLRIARMSGKSPVNTAQVQEVQGLLDRASQLAPSNPLLTAYRAQFLSIQGQLDKAVDLLAGSVNGEDRRTPEIWITLAQGLELLSKRAEALQTLDRALLPENAGDSPKLRIAKANFLVRSGQGQAAREVLSGKLEALKQSDRIELAKALAELLRNLGDRDGARTAYLEWARLEPRIPGPALSLLSMGQSDNDEKSVKLGLDALKAIGGDREPYGMAARALDLMKPDPDRAGTPSPERLYEAELLIKTLRQDVPSLRFVSLLEGILHENRGDLASAVKAYKNAQKDDIESPALNRLIEGYIKLKRFDELEALKREFVEEAANRKQPSLVAEFDRIAAAVALKLGDKDRADFFASRMVDERRDNILTRVNYAQMLDAHNKPEQAEESLRALAKDKPEDSRTWLTLIAFLNLRKSPAEVASAIGQARREYKGERPELFLAQCYWIGKELVQAKAAFQKAVEVKPKDLVTLRSLIEYYEDTNQSALAEPVLREVLKNAPSTAWASRALALKLSARQDPTSWQEAWDLVASPGDGPEERLVRATVLARSPTINRRNEAIPAFLSLVNDLPIASQIAIDTRLKLCQAFIDGNRFEEAWDTIRPVTEDMNRLNPTALVLGIEALARSKRPDEADRLLKRFIAADPKSAQVSLSKSWILMARGQQAEAASQLEAGFKEASSLPNAQAIGMAVLTQLIRMNEYQAGLRVAKAVALRWPADAWGLAWIQVSMKDYEGGLASCEIALEAGSPREAMRIATNAAAVHRDDPAFVEKIAKLGETACTKQPGDPNIRVYLGTVRHFQRRYEEELACYRKALELSPTNVQFLNNMAWTLSEGLNRPDEAMTTIQEAISREGDLPQYLDTRGVIEERLGHPQRAVVDLEKSAKADPSANTYFHLARAYLKAKNPEASRRYRDLALKAKFDAESLDPTDRADLGAVMTSP